MGLLGQVSIFDPNKRKSDTLENVKAFPPLCPAVIALAGLQDDGCLANKVYANVSNSGKL